MRKLAGFTLLEMLVALAVFAMLSLGGYQMLHGLSLSTSVSSKRSQQMAALERTFALMGADFRQAVFTKLRGVKGEGVAGGAHWLGSAQGGVSLARIGWRNIDAKEQRSEVLRVGYLVDNKGYLIRQFYRHLNPSAQQQPIRQKLLAKVRHLSFRFYLKGRGWQTSWHRNDQLPMAIEVEFKLSSLGWLRRIFLLPPGPQNEQLVQRAQEDLND
ncbi:type II secretion system minor pseudopilin GspJ [Celerinatantimonas diazotrophica]|uniref:Type II secretion system protein J n=1 Tax=Celerinatantimonas diazotrophica TaxID=412034 RepID=A0A4R1KDJ8_9GAMM|nr:type II secretion system minor pseudopilin GspJ [Celerinatantimonas diazotrophica]TCK62748.1 type II secretion system protein J (GspJ) [Celerinatantimonas diazotrophica]CAG9298378.1 Type II secretion system protein J [Celerinatantimonas diazotrophica]